MLKIVPEPIMALYPANIVRIFKKIVTPSFVNLSEFNGTIVAVEIWRACNKDVHRRERDENVPFVLKDSIKMFKRGFISQCSMR